MKPINAVNDNIVAPDEIAKENCPTPSKPIFERVILLKRKKNNEAVRVAKTDFLESENRLFK